MKHTFKDILENLSFCNKEYVQIKSSFVFNSMPDVKHSSR